MQEAVQFGPFGFGRARTLDQLLAFTSIDTRTRTHIGDPAGQCGTVRYVPCTGVPPEQGGYPNNMVHAPYWEEVKAALAAAGDWTQVCLLCAAVLESLCLVCCLWELEDSVQLVCSATSSIVEVKDLEMHAVSMPTADSIHVVQNQACLS